jgi:hypothetical protein
MDRLRDAAAHCYVTGDSTVECTAQRIRDGRYAGLVLVITVTNDGHEELRFTFTKGDPDAAIALVRARTWAHARYPPAAGVDRPGLSVA